jgi:hypothetical protein
MFFCFVFKIFQTINKKTRNITSKYLNCKYLQLKLFKVCSGDEPDELTMVRENLLKSLIEFLNADNLTSAGAVIGELISMEKVSFRVFFFWF